MNIQYDVWISFFDVIMVLLMIWGAYRGFIQGAVVQCVSLFCITIGLIICVNISKQVYKFLTPRSDVPDLFAIVLLAILFVVIIYFTDVITTKTIINQKDSPRGSSNRGLGAFLGATKYFFIAAIYLVTLFKIEEHAKFLPDREKYSRMSRACVWTITRIFPYLRMNKKDYKPFEYPSGTNNYEENNTEDY